MPQGKVLQIEWWNRITPNKTDEKSMHETTWQKKSHTIWQLFHQHFELGDAVDVSPLNEAMVRSCIGSWTDPNKYFEVLLAKHVPSGDFVGSCMYEKKFSFYTGKIISVDQLFVTEPFRGHKVGLK